MVNDKKGLKAIFGDNIDNILDEIDNGNNNLENSKEVPIEQIITNPHQPRKNFNEEKIKELSDSIKKHGIFTPLIVKKQSDHEYYLVAGERRLRAAKKANLKTVPIIKKDITDRQMQEISLLENIQREDLNPIEEAIAYDSFITKHNISQESFAKGIGKSRSHVTNTLRLLQLPDKILNYVTSGKLSFGHVRPLIGLDEEIAIKVSKRAFAEKLSVRSVESIVNGYKLNKTQKTPKKRSEDLEYVEKLLRNKFKTNVKVLENKIIFSYKEDDLNSLLKKMNALEE